MKCIIYLWVFKVEICSLKIEILLIVLYFNVPHALTHTLGRLAVLSRQDIKNTMMIHKRTSENQALLNIYLDIAMT